MRLTSLSSFILRSTGSVIADGAMGGNGVIPFFLPGNNGGGRGGNAIPGAQGKGASFGGRGAGGGIVVQLGANAAAVFEPGATVRSLGGGAHPDNGGTVKIIHGSPSAPVIPGGCVTAGRVLIQPAPSSVAGWGDY